MSLNEDIRKRVIIAIDEIKRNKGITYSEIMQSLNDIQQVHVQLKSGVRYPSFEHLYWLHKKYNYSFEWIFTGLPPKKTKKEKTPEERLNEMTADIDNMLQFLKRKSK